VSTVTADADILALAASLERVVTMVRRIVPSEGMSLTGISTLRTLDIAGPTRLTELSAAQCVTQPAMTQLVTRLERDGLVERRSSDLDGRVVLVALTDAGRDFLAVRRATRAHRLGGLMATLPAAERDAIIAAIPALTTLADLGQD
jgi:DNA-binding MarR family transcriptional regulator